MMCAQVWLVPAFALAAFLYSSIGHGGASAYLALGTLAGLAREDLVPLALLLNVAVAGIALRNFRTHLRKELLTPLISTSIPASFVGARIGVSSAAFAGLLGAVLFWSGVRISWTRTAVAGQSLMDGSATSGARKWVWAPACGLAIGLLSGMLGIGGGIILSPLLLLLRWADVKQTAALSAAFIVVNSVSGLLSHALVGYWPDPATVPFAVAAVVGALVGAHVGSRRVSSRGLALMLGGVLVLAGTKLLVTAVI